MTINRGERFNKFVAKMMAKGKTRLQAERLASFSSDRNKGRGKGR